jgi:hypothetical protein
MTTVAEGREIPHRRHQGRGDQQPDTGNRQQLLDDGQRFGLLLELGFQGIDAGFEIADLFEEGDQVSMATKTDPFLANKIDPPLIKNWSVFLLVRQPIAFSSEHEDM